MKLLMFTDVFFPDTIGGAGRVAYHLGLELSRMGHDVHVITRQRKRTVPSMEYPHKGLTIYRFPAFGKESLGLFLGELKNSYLMTKKVAGNEAFDSVCIHQAMAAIGPLLSGCLKGIPRIYYFHSPWHEEYLIKRGHLKKKGTKKERIIAWVMRRIEKRVLSGASAIIVLSRFMRDRIIGIHHLSKKKIIKIPGGIDLDHFRISEKGRTWIRQHMDLPPDRRIFITVRNLVPRMGLKNLIKACGTSSTLRNKSMLLIGGRGPLENDLKNMVQKSRLYDCIRFLGRVHDDDLPEIYQAADFFVLPTSKLEGFGLVILEAMACGTPVLGTPVGAIPELIGSFDKRLICKGTGWKDIQEKMEAVLERPDAYDFDPRTCRRFVEENYSWKKTADAFEKVVKGMKEKNY